MKERIVKACNLYFGEILIIVRKTEKKAFRYMSNRRVGVGFIMILDKKGKFKSNGFEKNLCPGDLLCVDQFDEYEISASEDGFDYITTAFSFGPEQSFRKSGIPTCVSFGEKSELIEKFILLEKTFADYSESHIIETRILLDDILLNIIRKISRQTSEGVHRIFPALRYINEHYQDDYSIGDLADMCILSQSYFRKMFIQYTGMSPSRYRADVKCAMAKNMLKSGVLNVSEIADKLGYCDVYHFSKEFKKNTGLSPRAYKNKLFERELN